MFLGIEFVIDDQGLLFNEHRIVQRGKKQVLQKFIEEAWYDGAHWEDIRVIENES